MITEFRDICAICGKRATETHHMIFGTANRKLSDEDGLTIPLCRDCHEAIHREKRLQVMSQIAGQLAYEKSACERGVTSAEARRGFMCRYGRSYL